jgi:hypothetical protein
MLGKAAVAKYVQYQTRQPSQTWRTFLADHVDQIVAWSTGFRAFLNEP